MSFRPSHSIKIAELLEYFSSTSQVRSALGAQLANMRDGTLGGGGDADVEQGLIDRANVGNCAAMLEKQQNVNFATCDVLPLFAKKLRARPGAVAAAVMRAYQPWACPVRHKEDDDVELGSDRGLAEVFAWMRRAVPSTPAPDHDEKISLACAFRLGKATNARARAAKLLADAMSVVSAWCAQWNRKAGFKTHITVTEFSERYKVDTTTVRRWCVKGRLSAERPTGKAWLIDVSNLDEDRVAAVVEELALDVDELENGMRIVGNI